MRKLNPIISFILEERYNNILNGFKNSNQETFMFEGVASVIATEIIGRLFAKTAAEVAAEAAANNAPATANLS